MADYMPVKKFLNDMDERLRVISGLIVKLEKKVMTYPEGRVRIQYCGKRKYYFHVEDGSDNNGKPIDKKDTKLINGLIQKNYLEKVILSARKEEAALKKAIESYPKTVAEDVYMSQSEERREHINPIVLPDDEYVKRWIEEKFEPEPFKEGVPYFATKRGERVRSKSEQLIADRLFEAGIPYKYECPLTIGKDTYYPDFTILRVRDRKVIYYEHLGKLDDEGYVTRNLNKMNNYALNGYLIGDNVVTTLESSKVPLDIRVVDKLIKDVFS